MVHMNPSNAPTPHPPAGYEARSRRRMYLAVILLLALFAAVVVFRREIRVRWWGYRLAATTDVGERTRYLGLLTTEPERAAPVARRLLAAEDAATRSFGVALALRVPGSAGDEMLKQALHDPDSAVRQGAIIGFSIRRTPEVTPTLRKLADDADLEVALSATAALSTAGGPEALAALGELARHHPQPGVRAQAISSLAELDAPEVVPALIDCLADDAVFAGLTATERDALDALQHVAPQLSGAAEMPRDAGRTNGERAAVALHAVTGQDFGYLEAEPETRGAIIERWRAWQAER